MFLLIISTYVFDRKINWTALINIPSEGFCMVIKVRNAASFNFFCGCFENNSPTVVTSSQQIRFVVTIRTDNRHLTINMII